MTPLRFRRPACTSRSGGGARPSSAAVRPAAAVPIAALVLVAGTLGAAAAPAQAQQQAHVGLGLYGLAGPTGLGAGLVGRLSPSVSLRGELSQLSWDVDGRRGDIDWDGKLKFDDRAVFVDFRPVPASSFRLVAGALFSDTRADLTGRPRGGTFTFNDQTVVAAGQSVTASADLPSTRPYLGIGWGLAGTDRPGLIWGLDLGVAYGRPDVTLRVSPLIAAQVSAADIEAERRKLQDDADKLRFLPVVKLSVGWAF